MYLSISGVYTWTVIYSVKHSGGAMIVRSQEGIREVKQNPCQSQWTDRTTVTSDKRHLTQFANKREVLLWPICLEAIAFLCLQLFLFGCLRQEVSWRVCWWEEGAQYILLIKVYEVDYSLRTSFFRCEVEGENLKSE